MSFYVVILHYNISGNYAFWCLLKLLKPLHVKIKRSTTQGNWALKSGMKTNDDKSLKSQTSIDRFLRTPNSQRSLSPTTSHTHPIPPESIRRDKWQYKVKAK